MLIWYMYYCWYENFINLIDLAKICDHACLQLKSCHSGNKNQYPSCHCNYAPTKIIHMYITYCYFWIFLKCLKGISCISHLDFLHKLIVLIYESSHHIDKKNKVGQLFLFFNKELRKIFRMVEREGIIY